MPTFSFIIPVKSGVTPIALVALQVLNDLPHPYEILVSEGNFPSKQRNVAAQQAQGEILFFLDDDSIVNSDCLNLCAEAMEDSSVAVVGGPSLTPLSDSSLQKIFGLALSSIFGAGSMRNRYRASGATRRTTEKELILCNMAIRRQVFITANGFDERLYPNEENELLDRISEMGFNLIHIPKMAVNRSQRQTLNAFVRQMFSYGRGRAEQTIIAKKLGSFIGLIPLAFVIYLVLIPLFAKNLFFAIPLLIYVFLDLIFTSAILFSTRNPAAVFLVAIFPIMHCANGAGLGFGFLKKKPIFQEAAKPQIKIIKSMT